MYKKVQACRICGNKNLLKVLDLGEQMLTGVFLDAPEQGNTITAGPLSLVKCQGDDYCGLVQLEHSYDLNEMYGDNYGYRSGLNKSMVHHLHSKVAHIRELIALSPGDLIIDIGSNDSTTLQAYPLMGLILAGIDPTAEKFANYYPAHIELIPEFFSKQAIQSKYGIKKAKVITSFSMFYDLEDPIGFMREVYEVLDDEGIWVFEQSYMPTMLSTNSFDTICHEHIEFYALKQIKYMTDIVGFHILDVEFNDVNGGSFSVSVRKKRVADQDTELVCKILKDEKASGFDSLEPFEKFAVRVERAKKGLLDFINRARSEGKKVAALGASTKGNVLLQYCNITTNEISCVGEVNVDKFGKFTPGTYLPICSEDEVLQMNPDYLIVLPWHFRSFFITNPKYSGQKLVFPLPSLEIFG